MSISSKISSVVPLPNIDDVTPISDEDKPCLDEIRDVLTRRNTLRRFGVCLLHEHFPIADDETMLETCDAERRTLTNRPIATSFINNWISA
jgi:hypothetical protein